MTRSRQIAAVSVAVLAVAAVVITLLFVVPARSRPDIASASSHMTVSRGEVADSAPQIDQSALTALERMGSYLRTLTAFQIKADVVTEDVRTDGQKVQIIRTVDLVARRPNRLFADVRNDRQRRLFFYDGSNFTLFAPRSGYFATLPAPKTIEGLADQLEDKYGIELPLVDLFRWGTAEGDLRVITSAIDLGPSAINGLTCEQYAYRQDGLDWQLWLQRGDQPLPCRVVITTLTDDARPQHATTYTWNLAPSYDDDTFLFRVPTGAKRIPFAAATPAESTSVAQP